MKIQKVKILNDKMCKVFSSISRLALVERLKSHASKSQSYLSMVNDML